MGRSANRTMAKEAGVGGIHDFEDKEWTKEYLHVTVGVYGVVIPDVINLDTLEGLTLVKGKGSVIANINLADRIAKETNGKVIEVIENYSRIAREINS